jgi:FAD/FMN-containing dehydrogenase
MATNYKNLPIIWRDEADPEVYELARVGRVFNERRPKRYPLAVVEAAEESHIVQAAKLAVKRQCRISIRSGGHSWAAWSVRDEAILIDLGKYHEISLDKEKLIVSVSPSTTGRVLNEFLNEKGLMFAGGHCPDVGLGGFLLQGGMGWNCKVDASSIHLNYLMRAKINLQNWGWACEKVAAIDVVTGNGDLLHCDSKQNSDLLWAAKGAGPGTSGSGSIHSLRN